jgi:predicted unusual protein kinase regulating ubiquinone biosynthesis (AarF/ABC1/UbiB family)
LENIGPAGIKLGQALGSSPDVPANIREVMQTMKNHADQPTRWELYELLDATVPPEHQGEIGKVIGSGSYFITVVKGNEVLGILRPNARARAEDGFNVMLNTCDKLSAYPGDEYKQFSTILKNIITKAQTMTDIEVDLEVGAKQDELAHQIYDDRKLKINGDEYTCKVATWQSHGDEYKEVAKVNGEHFNDFPAGTFKSNLAKAYVELELCNVFSGGNFDHDRHGAQLKIDRENKTIGIFDNGAMSICPPNTEEKKQLGIIINKVISKSIVGNDIGGALIDSVKMK